jgi:5-methylcytosine-specific restriction endonuclease McrA
MSTNDTFYKDHILNTLEFLKTHYSPEQCDVMRSKRNDVYILVDGKYIHKKDIIRAQVKAGQYKYRRTQHGHARESGRNDVKKFILNALKHNKTRCPICRKWFLTNTMTVDHIVPLKHAGTNNAYNLRMTCKRCNSSKGSRMPIGLLPLR